MDDDERMINIETKLAHQEDLLLRLNDALSSQQLQVAGLERLCQTLIERIRALSDSGGGDGSDVGERPPHY